MATDAQKLEAQKVLDAFRERMFCPYFNPPTLVEIIEKQRLTLKQALMLSYRLCEARMRKPNQPFATQKEIELEVDALIERVEII